MSEKYVYGRNVDGWYDAYTRLAEGIRQHRDGIEAITTPEAIAAEDKRLWALLDRKDDR